MAHPKVRFGTPVATHIGHVHLIDKVYLYWSFDRYRLAAMWKCGATSHDVRLLAAPVSSRRECPRCDIPSWVTGDPMVYFARRDGLIKIGCSREPHNRMRTLKAEPILAIPGGRSDEKALHQRFAHLQHLVGSEREWFDPGADLLDHIASLSVATRAADHPGEAS